MTRIKNMAEVEKKKWLKTTRRIARRQCGKIQRAIASIKSNNGIIRISRILHRFVLVRNFNCTTEYGD